MCGLAGIYNYGAPLAEPLSEATGLRMIDALSHRGPDDGGLIVTPRLLLGHRRLSILDLTADGHQPMSDEREECWIAFNGEIYNFRELRRELEAAGQIFRSRTDTEVILRGYRQWGISIVERLNGMYAFALWDRRDASFRLVRDPIGIKPLFYRDDGRSLWFGSEIKAILADPSIPRRPDLAGLDRFLTFGYTPAPWTGFAGIRQVAPGEILEAKDERITARRWDRLPYPQRRTKASPAECTERLQSALDAAVARQRVSDVPLGALLSGGLDSSAVVRAMRRTGAEQVDTFTISFPEQSFDESDYARRVAERYGTRHHVQRVEPNVQDILQTVVAHAEEPIADNSMIPFFLLSEHVRRHVTVALSGDGADELMGGYATYSASQWSPYYRSLPGWMRSGLIEPLVSRLPDTRRKYGKTMLLRRFVSAASRPFPYDHCSWRRIVSEDLRRDLYTPEFLAANTEDPLDCYAKSLTDVPEDTSPLERQLHLDLRFHLPNDLLVKVDRMSMAHSLEVRVPFLDQEVIAACLAMPPECRRQGRYGKLPLRGMLKADLPADLIHRKKAGFLIPLESWLKGPWRPLLQSRLTEEFARSTGLFQGRTLLQMIDRHAQDRGDFSYALFSLLMLSLWWDTWIAQTSAPRCHPVTARPARIHRLFYEKGD